MAGLEQISKVRIFGGFQMIYSHDSKELGCKMNFAVYLPPDCELKKVPVIYWLSGLECTEKNFIEKAGAQKYASENGVAIVGPDTSPRGSSVPDDAKSWDFGMGAGFYVDATESPWNTNYRMYSYVTKELPDIINKNFPVIQNKQSIMGHSMGGHGALICALKNPGKYCSVSAFAPICNPIECNWGKKAFKGYLGTDTDKWTEWDATELAKKYPGPPLHVLIDQGTEDTFYKDQKQLLPENLVAACHAPNINLKMKFDDGYNHSYYFIATFIEEHIKHHMTYLSA